MEPIVGCLRGTGHSVEPYSGQSGWMVGFRAVSPRQDITPGPGCVGLGEARVDQAKAGLSQFMVRERTICQAGRSVRSYCQWSLGAMRTFGKRN